MLIEKEKKRVFAILVECGRRGVGVMCAGIDLLGLFWIAFPPITRNSTE
jgi:hypothetical protein